MCTHEPRCPSADASDRDAARVVFAHPEQGWSLLCNGVIAFEDGTDLLPLQGRVPLQRSAGVGGAGPLGKGHADAA